MIKNEPISDGAVSDIVSDLNTITACVEIHVHLYFKEEHAETDVEKADPLDESENTNDAKEQVPEPKEEINLGL